MTTPLFIPFIVTVTYQRGLTPNLLNFSEISINSANLRSKADILDSQDYVFLVHVVYWLFCRIGRLSEGVGMFTKKYRMMGMTALSLILFLLTNSVTTSAVESGAGVGEGLVETVESYEINEDEIWAQIDKEELRSLVDVEKLKALIDEEALLQKINRQELMAGISELSLLQSMGEAAILAEFEERKASGELDELINEIKKARTYLGEETEDVYPGDATSVISEDDNVVILADESEMISAGEPTEDAGLLIIPESDPDTDSTMAIVGEDGTSADTDSDSSESTPSAINESGTAAGMDSDNSAKIGQTVDTDSNGSEITTDTVDENVPTADTDPDDSVIVRESAQVAEATLKTEPFSAEEHPIDIIDVVFPIIGDNSPFDYIVDPLGLIYATDAAKYGYGKVQADAGVLFKNSEGEYDFSNTSDYIKIVNRSNIPVKVVLTATLQGSTNARIVDSIEMLEEASPSLYLALTDQNGIVSAFTESGKSVVTATLNPAPDETYHFMYDEASGEYQYEMAKEIDESAFDSFSFAVTADCNTQADWSDVTELPTISLSWAADPVLTDWDKINAELEAEEKELFEAFKNLKLKELREEELDRLVQIRLEELIAEELKRLIDEEVERLAQEKFKELKLAAIEAQYGIVIKSENNDDSEELMDMDESKKSQKKAVESMSESEDLPVEESQQPAAYIDSETGEEIIEDIDNSVQEPEEQIIFLN